jgi:hypothetical protein
MGVRDLRKELTEMHKEVLEGHIIQLYQRYPSVKKYFDFYLNSDEGALLNRYKEQVHQCYFPAKGKRVKYAKARKVIGEFKKIAVSPEVLAELDLFAVQVALIRAREERSGSVSYYDRVTKNFRAVLEYLEKQALLPQYKETVLELVDRSEGLPWQCKTQLQQVASYFYG